MKHHVYIIQSISDLSQFYTGLCADIDARLAAQEAQTKTAASFDAAAPFQQSN